MNTKRLLTIIGGIVAIGAIVLVAGYFYLDYIGGDSEATKDIEEVLEEVDEEAIANAGEGARVFQIIDTESEARFEIDETLAGNDIVVVGRTGEENDIIGQIVIDPNNPQAATVGTITINVKTLETDQPRRDDAIRTFILKSNQPEYEFVTFRPTAIEGLPESVAIGEPFNFQITGDLTIVDTTRSVTFDVTVIPVSETRIEGTAQTTILYADFGLEVPMPPAVSFVGDEVTLVLTFAAEEIDPSAAPEATENPFGA